MCEKCDERCAKAGYVEWRRRLQESADLGGVSLTAAWIEIARAVREAGRLSECPDAVEALAIRTASFPWNRGDAMAKEAARALAKDSLRTAEDAALVTKRTIVINSHAEWDEPPKKACLIPTDECLCETCMPGGYPTTEETNGND